MSTENGYQEIFQTYIVAGVEASLARVRKAGAVIAEADRQQAWQALSYALAVANAWPSVRELLLTLTPKMFRAGHWSEWVPYLERGLEQSKAQRDLDAAAELSFHLGYLQQRLGHLANADHHAAAAVDLFARQNSRQRQGAALNRHAAIKRSRRDFAAAERLTDTALALLNTEDAADREECGHAFLIKGRIAFEQRLWSLAGECFARALGFYEQTENQGRIAVCTQNLGRVCYQEEDYDGAVAHYERAIELLEETNDAFEAAAVQMNLGIVYSLSGRPETALGHYSKAEGVFRRLQDRANLARLFNNQGMEMNNLQRWDDAKSLLHASSALWLELDNLQGYLNAQGSLGLAYMGGKEFDHAIQIFEDALVLAEKHADRTFAKKTLFNLTEYLHNARTERGARLQLSQTRSTSHF